MPYPSQALIILHWRGVVKTLNKNIWHPFNNLVYRPIAGTMASFDKSEELTPEVLLGGPTEARRKEDLNLSPLFFGSNWKEGNILDHPPGKEIGRIAISWFESTLAHHQPHCLPFGVSSRMNLPMFFRRIVVKKRLIKPLWVGDLEKSSRRFIEKPKQWRDHLVKRELRETQRPKVKNWLRTKGGRGKNSIV